MPNRRDTDAPKPGAGVSDPRARWLVLCCALLSASVFPACSQRNLSRPAPQPERSVDLADGTGLQLLTWTIGPATAIVPPLVDAPQPAIAPPLLTLWEQHGLLIARVRESDLASWSAQLNLTTRAQQQLLAFGASRAEAVRGPVASSDVLRLDESTMPINDASVRLLIRGWPVPAMPGLTPSGETPQTKQLPAAVQVELLPQVTPRTRARRSPLDPVDNSIEAQGVVLSRLAIETTLYPGEALVVFPSRTPAPSPRDALTTPAQPANVPQTREKNADEPVIEGPRIVASQEIGPLAPTLENLPTLGDALLTDCLSLPSDGQRTLLIIVPRPPKSYSLLK
jgi:hypothetical protein